MESPNDPKPSIKNWKWILHDLTEKDVKIWLIDYYIADMVIEKDNAETRFGNGFPVKLA